jgi:hypothetical protein
MVAVQNINPYLVDADDSVLRKDPALFSSASRMRYALQTADGGFLDFSPTEVEEPRQSDSDSREISTRIHGRWVEPNSLQATTVIVYGLATLPPAEIAGSPYISFAAELQRVPIIEYRC